MSPKDLPTTYVPRTGVDVGGTFTDVVVIDESGRIHTHKLPSTPADFSNGVIEGIGHVVRGHSIDTGVIRDVVHGSTVATNAILERKGANTALLTTDGFRDILELRRLRMPKLYDMTWKKPEPLVPRSKRHEIKERVGISGDVVIDLDLNEARRQIKSLVAEGVESLAVSLIHSYANPSHEVAIGELIASEFPELWFSLSHRVLPVIREYERTSTTVLNAYVRPTVASYLSSLRRKLDERQITAPVLILQSNGGVMASDAAAERPAYIVESGPAAGVIASAALARSIGLNEVITFDMGGTTAKASLVENGEPHFTSEFEVASSMSAGSRLSSGGGYALSVPFIDLAEVGAGGGSIVWIDPAGAPKIGPQSAGADPGPVCYGNGGTHPTVTDANLLLGYLNSDGLLNGTMPLDEPAARVAFDRDVASPLGLEALDAAFGCHQIANASMIRAIKSVSVQRGRDPRDFTLFAFGGSGPVHAVAIAKELGIRQVLVPPQPGVFSAVGLLQARLEFRAKKTFLRRTEELQQEDLKRQIRELEHEARMGIGEAKVETGSFIFEPWIEMRYVGQGFELPIKMPDLTKDWPTWSQKLEEAYSAQHEITYGHRTRNPTEVVHLMVVAKEASPPGVPAGQPPDSSPERTPTRQVYFGKEYGLLETAVLRREQVSHRVGPCIIEDYDSTTVVPPDFTVHRDSGSNLLIRPSEQS